MVEIDSVLIDAQKIINRNNPFIVYKRERLTKDDLKKIIITGIQKGYRSIREFSDQELEEILNR